MKALRATKENLTYFESQRGQLEADNLERRGEAEAVAGKLEGLSVVLIRQAGDTGQLYGSVSARDMAEAVTESGARVDRDQIQLEETIKVLGRTAKREKCSLSALIRRVVVEFVEREKKRRGKG